MSPPRPQFGGFPSLPDLPKLAAGAVAELSTGRSCLTLLMTYLAPRRVFLSHYTCPVVPEHLLRLGIDIAYVPVDERLEMVERPALAPDELLVVPNLFGWQGAYVDELATPYGRQLVVDASQAWWHRPKGDEWVFTSARKFFGVPDGAALFGPKRLRVEGLPRATTTATHLEARLHGRDDALALFRDSESRADTSAARVSLLSLALWRSADPERERAARVANARRLAKALGTPELRSSPDDVPLCFPWWREDVDRGTFIQRRIWVPTYWPGLPEQADPAFEVSRRAAAHIIPLPVDGRQDAEAVDHIVRVAGEVP